MSEEANKEKTATTKFLKAQGLTKAQIDAIRLFIDKKERTAITNTAAITVILMLIVYAAFTS